MTLKHWTSHTLLFHTKIDLKCYSSECSTRPGLYLLALIPTHNYNVIILWLHNSADKWVTGITSTQKMLILRFLLCSRYMKHILHKTNFHGKRIFGMIRVTHIFAVSSNLTPALSFKNNNRWNKSCVVTLAKSSFFFNYLYFCVIISPFKFTF